MKPIIIWKVQKWEHNHIEQGHSDRDIPLPNSKLQTDKWNNEIWHKRHAYFDGDNKVVDKSKD